MVLAGRVTKRFIALYSFPDMVTQANNILDLEGQHRTVVRIAD